MLSSARPANITTELFLEWRSPVRGTANPQSMTNPVWKWLVDSRLNAYQANELFHGPSSLGAGPCWCFDRFGQSRSSLPDGRTLLIAGEHEDHYDPDFFIYNDVVIVSPNGDVEIFGYPTDLFPPTDFHSATLADGQIVLVGNLGYPSDRRKGVTQVLTLELDHWRVRSVETEGVGPGWIHEHSARLESDGRSICISGGKVDRCNETSLVENIDDWRLSLADWKWERLTTRRWARFEVFREDKHPLHLWEMGQALWSKEVGWDDAQEQMQNLQVKLGSPPRLDILPLLYRPEVSHEELPNNPDEYGVHRIRAGGIVVRYVEDMFSVQVTVEGDLPADGIEQIRRDLIGKLQALEQAPIVSRVIPPA